MDSFGPPSIPAGTRTLRAVEITVLTLVTTLSLIAFTQPPDATLDGSWQEMLGYAHAHGLQFGREVIFTWGPWGFLCSRYHLGALGAPLRIAWEIGGNLGIAFSITLLCRPLPFWRRITFALLFIGFDWIFQDLIYFVAITLIGLSGLMRRDAKPLSLAVWAVALGFLSQIKFTYFLLSAAAVGASMLLSTLRQSRLRSTVIGASFFFGVLGWWIAAGQNPDHLYPYIVRSFQIASAYGDAMGFGEPWPVFVWGVVLAITCIVFLVNVWRTAKDRDLALAGTGFLAFAFLLAWKEGFTRADGHVFGFFGYAVMVAPLAAGFLLPERRFHWFDASFLIGIAGIGSFAPTFVTLEPLIVRQRIEGNLHALPQVRSFPGSWQQQYVEACRKEELPLIRSAVGSGTVDVYDFSLGAALLNGMNIGARPIFQGYTAYTPSLEGWNLRFYQSDRAPDYVVWKGEGMDNRYPGQDDAMLLARLPGSYEPLFSEKGFWLFHKRHPIPKGIQERLPVLERTVRIGEEVEVPQDTDQVLWLRAHATPNTLGRVRGVLYRPAQLDLVVTDSAGAVRSWRVVPRVAEDGFILAPRLETGADMAALMQGKATSWPRSFHFDAPDGQAEFWSHIDLGVFRIPSLPVKAEIAGAGTPRG